ncbi:hypothetical protein GCM10023259_042250 [Thermocatellispora tengchongensis]
MSEARAEGARIVKAGLPFSRHADDVTADRAWGLHVHRHRPLLIPRSILSLRRPAQAGGQCLGLPLVVPARTAARSGAARGAGSGTARDRAWRGIGHGVGSAAKAVVSPVP